MNIVIHLQGICRIPERQSTGLFRRIAIAALIFGILCGPAVSQTHRVNETTGAQTWEISVHGVTLSLTQILPDQARAFYQNRGFPEHATELYATSCVFMTILRNDTAPGVVHFLLKDWSVITDGRPQFLVELDAWMEIWKNHDLGKAALVAFRWAQFPPEQFYEPGGDWNQGMLTTGLPAGATFDLVARWDISGIPYQGELLDVRCAH